MQRLVEMSESEKIEVRNYLLNHKCNRCSISKVFYNEKNYFLSFYNNKKLILQFTMYNFESATKFANKILDGTGICVSF